MPKGRTGVTSGMRRLKDQTPDYDLLVAQLDTARRPEEVLFAAFKMRGERTGLHITSRDVFDNLTRVSDYAKVSFYATRNFYRNRRSS